jgi:hypothetical protein
MTDVEGRAMPLAVEGEDAVQRTTTDSQDQGVQPSRATQDVPHPLVPDVDMPPSVGGVDAIQRTTREIFFSNLVTKVSSILHAPGRSV